MQLKENCRSRHGLGTTRTIKRRRAQKKSNRNRKIVTENLQITIEHQRCEKQQEAFMKIFHSNEERHQRQIEQIKAKVQSLEKKNTEILEEKKLYFQKIQDFKDEQAKNHQEIEGVLQELLAQKEEIIEQITKPRNEQQYKDENQGQELSKASKQVLVHQSESNDQKQRGVGKLDDIPDRNSQTPDDAQISVTAQMGDTSKDRAENQLSYSMDKFKDFYTLGKGSYGQVFGAWDTISSRFVAIKYNHQNSSTRKEAAFMQLLRHPRIICLYDLCTVQQEGVFGADTKNRRFFKAGSYIVMEKVAGVTLAQVHNLQITAEKALKVLEQVLEGCEYMHSKKIIHRDLHLANIMIDKGQVKIIDFGMAMEWSGTAKRQNPLTKGREDDRVVLYPEEYRAPELWKGDRFYDEKIDIWAIGVVFIWLATKKYVFAAPAGKHLSVIRGRFPVHFDQWAKQNSPRPNVDPEVRVRPFWQWLEDATGHYEEKYRRIFAVLGEKMLTVDPIQRPGASQILHALREFKRKQF